MSQEKDRLTVMFSSYPKFFKYLFQDFDYTKFGFSKAMLFILTVLRYRARDDGIKMSQLESHAGLKKSTLSESVDVLVKKGYVERTRSNEDRRVVKVKLTEMGKRKADEIMKSVKMHVDKKLDFLSEEEKQKLFEAFEFIERISEMLKERR